jgi:FecR protein
VILPKNCIATNACLLAMLLSGTPALADPIGTVTALSGSLLVKHANGAIAILAVDSPLQAGDTLASRKDTYARLTLTDYSSVTLASDTELIMERYSFDQTPTQSQNNTAVLNLARGRVHIVTGLLGKRSADTFTLTTPSATIDIRGSDMIAEYIAPDRSEVASIGYTAAAAYKHVRMRSFTSRAPLLLAANSSANLQLAQNTMPPPSAARAPGLYVQVLDGAIHLTNGGGTQNFTAGQFGFTPGFQTPPVILPANPGMQFTPPPSFSSSTGSPGGTAGSKPGSVDCVVR